MKLIPRKNQEEVIQKSRDSILKGNKKIIIHAPTGFGKTVVAAIIISLARKKKCNVLFLANRRELIFQSYETLTSGGNKAGIIMAGEHPDLSNDLQIASMQTYVRRMNLDEKTLNPWFHLADLIIVDECHGAISPSYQKILNNYDDNVIVLGLTATPCRADGRGLGEYFEDIVSSDGIGKLIIDNHLVPVRYFVPSDPELEKIKTVAGDFNKKELAEVMDKNELVGGVVENWLKIAENRQTIVFAVNVKHSVHIVEQFIASGIKAEHVDARTSKEERADILKRLRNGETQVVSNVGILTEGFDFPAAGCIVLARPTKSLGLYLQMSGRGLRTCPEVGKTDCILIDHGGCVDMHGLIEWDREWSLDGKEKAWSKPIRKEKKTVVRCRACKLVFEGSDTCPDCGTTCVSFGKKINTLDADLKELKAKKQEPTMAEKRVWFGMMLSYAKKKGWSEGAAAHRYKSKYGVWPNKFKGILPIDPDKKFLNYQKHLQIKYAKSKNKKK